MRDIDVFGVKFNTNKLVRGIAIGVLAILAITVFNIKAGTWQFLVLVIIELFAIYLNYISEDYVETNEQLYEEALEAIRKLFGDTSVSQSETKANLNSLIGEIQIMADTLSESEE